ncbi:Crp/Fnr family transcriptional regulator [Solemya velesiana gill symbiont]|nr:Crp/Fnr family transcriptional regulator [Solemya velesiana gill symbiont]
MQPASVVELDKGYHICDEGSRCSHLTLVISGTARVYKLGENGREITLYRVDPGESCILTASCILSNQPFPAFAVSESPMEAALIPAPEVNQWLAYSEAWRQYVFGLISRRLSNIINVVEEVVFRRMDRRIADYLLKRVSNDEERLQITHQEIASDLGTSGEVVSRILKDLETSELIHTTRGTIEITDITGLENKTLET